MYTIEIYNNINYIYINYIYIIYIYYNYYNLYYILNITKSINIFSYTKRAINFNVFVDFIEITFINHLKKYTSLIYYKMVAMDNI